jgi:putative Ca2+/H+ antiporter (TMEM165/GDT1 family)
MLTGFTAGLLLITVSELGDKTFFISAILAMRHPRRWVFLGAIAALAAMTILSVLVGQTASFLPRHYVKYAEIVLFLGFGLKLLYDASRMSDDSCAVEEQEEAMNAVKQAEMQLPQRATALAILIEAFTLTFLAEWGDRTQIATITLSAANNAIGVTTGAILGHALTILGGVLFLIFAAVGVGTVLTGRI